MTSRPNKAPVLRKPGLDDFVLALRMGVQDFRAAPLAGMVFAGLFVLAGLGMAIITRWTGQTFWLVLAALGFPLIGTLGAVGFYDISQRLTEGREVQPRDIVSMVWSLRKGQLPWLATIVVVIFLFWFFLGHMIFALFLGLSPMTNISTSFAVFATADGAAMIGIGSLVGACFAALVFAITVHGIPTLVDRDIDFMTAALTSFSAVAASPLPYLLWGAFVGVVTLLSLLPVFLGLFVTMPVLGHATWHLYKALSDESG